MFFARPFASVSATLSLSSAVSPVRHAVGLLIVGMLAGIPVQSSRAQETPEACADLLEAADTFYRNRNYQEAITQASACATRTAAEDSMRVRAYRLMGLAFLRQNALQQARQAVANILAIDPTYGPNPVSDPPSYSLFVSLVRQDVSSTAPNRRVPADASVGANGFRLTYRDDGFERVNGLNITVWRPRNAGALQGRINGLALGLPLTGATRIHGVTLGLFADAAHAMHGVGVGAAGLSAAHSAGIMVGGLGLYVNDRFTGISLNGLAAGGTGSLRGLMAGGLGVGTAASLTGISVGPVGVGAGERMTGLQVGGLGVGAGRSIRGLSVGGLSVFSWRDDVYGVQVGGLGVGAADDIGGLSIGPVGVGSGGRITGVTVGGAFARAGEDVRGIQAAGLALLGSAVRGLSAAAVVVAEEGTGLTVAPAYFRTGSEASYTGISASAFNHIRGEQRGLAIGVLNMARRLNGVQVGVLNYAGNNPLFLRLLPGLNVNL